MFFTLNGNSKNTAIITQREEYDYGTLFSMSEKIVENIRERSLVLVLCENSPFAIAGYVGFLNHGIVPIMIDAGLDDELLFKLIKIYRPSWCWMPQNSAGKFPKSREALSLGDYMLLNLGEREPFFLHENLALLMTTSGSTGSPKLARLSYENIFSNTKSIIEYLKIDENERSVTNLPMHYVYGLSIINTHLKAGGSLVVTDKTMFQKEFWQFFKGKYVTNFGGVPYTFEMLLRLRFFRMNLPHLKTITQAGGKLDPALHQAFAEYAKEQGKRFVVMYGAAEATARMGYLPWEESLNKIGSIGIAIPGGKFELRDENSDVINTPNTAGELVYYGDNVCMGYATSGEDLAKGDENRHCLKTGDIAKRDEDGYYTIIGRKSRFLKIFGKRINLQEVEELLHSRFPTKEAICAGHDDKMFAFFSDHVDFGEIVSYLSEKLKIHPSAFSVKILPEIPKTTSGKPLYRELEQYYDL